MKNMRNKAIVALMGALMCVSAGAASAASGSETVGGGQWSWSTIPGVHATSSYFHRTVTHSASAQVGASKIDRDGEGPGLTYGILFDPKLQDYVKFYFNYYALNVYQEFPTREAKRNANKFWETTFCEVVDCMDKTIKVRIFEEDSIYADVGLEKTTIINGLDNFKASLK